MGNSSEQQHQSQPQYPRRQQSQIQQETATIETCPDDHHCLNGSKCVENPYSEGSYYCDCDEVVFEAAYEGLRCEHKADVYCVSEGISKHTFCTNNGLCIERVGPDSAHMGCECPPEYEGSFCQFVKGTTPSGWPFLTKTTAQQQTAQQQTTSSNGAVAVGAILGICLGGLLTAGLLWWKREWVVSMATGSDPKKDNATGEDLLIDPDGEELKRTMEERNGSPATASTRRPSLDLYEIGDDQVP